MDQKKAKKAPIKKVAVAGTTKKARRQEGKKMQQRKRKLEMEAYDSSSTSVSSVSLDQRNTSSDISLEDFRFDDDMGLTEEADTLATVPTDIPTAAADIETPPPVDKTSKGLVNDNDIGKYVAIYYSDPRPCYYWGKITKVFSDDDETDINAVEVDFLKKKTITSDPLC